VVIFTSCFLRWKDGGNGSINEGVGKRAECRVVLYLVSSGGELTIFLSAVCLYVYIHVCMNHFFFLCVTVQLVW